MTRTVAVRLPSRALFIWVLVATLVLTACSPISSGGLSRCGYCPYGPLPRGPLGPVELIPAPTPLTPYQLVPPRPVHTFYQD